MPRTVSLFVIRDMNFVMRDMTCETGNYGILVDFTPTTGPTNRGIQRRFQPIFVTHSVSSGSFVRRCLRAKQSIHHRATQPVTLGTVGYQTQLFRLIIQVVFPHNPISRRTTLVRTLTHFNVAVNFHMRASIPRDFWDVASKGAGSFGR